jgi:ribosome-associated protein
LLTPEQFAVEAAKAADEKKAIDVRIMDMRESLGITDYFVICGGKTERQVRRIQDSIEERLREKGSRPVRREGEKFARWILLDCVDFVVHIFREEERSYYDLEHLWKDVPTVEWRPDHP